MSKRKCRTKDRVNDDAGDGVKGEIFYTGNDVIFCTCNGDKNLIGNDGKIMWVIDSENDGGIDSDNCWDKVE